MGGPAAAAASPKGAQRVSSSFSVTAKRTKNKSLSRALKGYLPKRLQQTPAYRNLSDQTKKRVEEDAKARVRTLIGDQNWQAMKATEEAIRQALAALSAGTSSDSKTSATPSPPKNDAC